MASQLPSQSNGNQEFQWSSSHHSYLRGKYNHSITFGFSSYFICFFLPCGFESRKPKLLFHLPSWQLSLVFSFRITFVPAAMWEASPPNDLSDHFIYFSPAYYQTSADLPPAKTAVVWKAQTFGSCASYLSCSGTLQTQSYQKKLQPVKP